MGNSLSNVEELAQPSQEEDLNIQQYLKDATARFVRKYHSLNNNKVGTEETKSLKDFILYRCLGKGAFANVYLSQDLSIERQLYAMKVLNKRQILRDNQEDHVLAEKRLLNAVSFPFLIKLHYSFQDFSHLYLTLEFMAGGELFSLLRSRKYFNEDTTRFYCGQVVLSLEYLHHLNIAYRDLKPENILLGVDGYLKIADFGFAKLVPNRTYTLCGTPEYLAPEIISMKGYSRAVDWWAFGVLIFELIAGFSPFFSKENQRVYEKILVNKYSFPRHFSSDVRSLISKLLQPDLTKRIGTLRNKVNDVKDHRWFNHQINWYALFQKQIPLPLEIKNYNFNKNLSLGSLTILTIDTHDVYSKSFDNF